MIHHDEYGKEINERISSEKLFKLTNYGILLYFLITFGVLFQLVSSILNCIDRINIINLFHLLGIIFVWIALLIIPFIFYNFNATNINEQETYTYHHIDDSSDENKTDICLINGCICNEYEATTEYLIHDLCICGHSKECHILLNSSNEYFEHPDNLRLIKSEEY